MSASPEARRRDMVDLIVRRGVTDKRVLAAMRKLPRHLFVEPEHEAEAYEDKPLPIGLRQTISQPYIVAYMSERLGLTGAEKVLEVGTGSGYQTAVLAELAGSVFSVEVEPELARRAKDRLAALGRTGVRLRVGNGMEGWPEEAPFDRILVTASVPIVPPALVEQLAPEGLLLAPIGLPNEQRLVEVRRTSAGETRTELIPVMFVLAHAIPEK